MDGKEGKRMNKKKQAGQALLLAAALVLPAASMIKIFILAKAYGISKAAVCAGMKRSPSLRTMWWEEPASSRGEGTEPVCPFRRP